MGWRCSCCPCRRSMSTLFAISSQAGSFCGRGVSRVGNNTKAIVRGTLQELVRCDAFATWSKQGNRISQAFREFVRLSGGGTAGVRPNFRTFVRHQKNQHVVWIYAAIEKGVLVPLFQLTREAQRTIRIVRSNSASTVLNTFFRYWGGISWGLMDVGLHSRWLLLGVEKIAHSFRINLGVVTF